jgi:dihydrofolate reductase
MKVKLIVAMDKNKGIGRNNDLLWHLPNDMKFFRETTQNSVVVMGRKNWESIPERFRPLPNRDNIVITRNPNYQEQTPNAVVRNWDEFLHILNDLKFGKEDVYIIGGGEIYKMALESDIVDEMLITHVKTNIDDVDVRFPNYDETVWHQAEHLLHQTVDDKHKYEFDTYRYTKYAVINNGRKVYPGDQVLCYTEEKSFSWNNGHKIIKGFSNGSIAAYNKGSDPNDDAGITYYGSKILY